jgi:hypothetical protein
MKGDFSRRTFDPTKHYRGVLMQQGRVQVDADWNEEVEAAYTREVTEARDEIGASGVPNSAPDSFKIGIAATGTDLTIGNGRIYVDGILCVKDQPDTLLTQHDSPLASATVAGFPDLAAGTAAPTGTYCVYLDVWDRHITAVEDPSIREKALGGPDTATRVRTVWQVRLQRAGDLAASITCANFVPPAKSGAQLRASVQPGGTATPCVLPPQTGYRRLENQLYRVEIHKPGALGTATFKWSRENGSVVTAILPSGGGSGLTFPVQTTGRDDVLGFAPNQWVELSDDRSDLIAHRGQLLQISTVDPAKREITVKPPSSGPAYDPTLHPKLRLWNQQGGSEVAEGVTVTAGPIALEDGLQIEFQGASFAIGDYWLIPARTAIDNTVGNIEWPEQSPGVPAWLPPGTENHHYAPLALVGFDGTRFQPINGLVPDCRNPFDDLVTLTKRRSGSGCCTVSVSPKDLTGGVTLQNIIDKQKGNSFVTFCLQPGVYPLAAPLRLDATHSSFTISGCPGGAILQAAAPAAGAVAASFTDGLISISHATGIKLDNLTFNLATSPFPYSPYAKLVQACIGIRAMDCDGLTVRNCTFRFPSLAQGDLFAAGIFGGGILTGWTIDHNLFTGDTAAFTTVAGDTGIFSKDPAGITRRRQFTAGLLVHPTLLLANNATVSADTKLVRAGFGGAAITGNTFTGLGFASLVTADSGDVRCSNNEVHHCYEGFWFLSLESLQLLTPGQEVSVDPVYNDSVGVWVYLIAAAFQEVTFYTEAYLAFLYSVPQGWAPDNASVLTSIPMKPVTGAASFAQKLVDHATNAIKNVGGVTAQPAPAPTPAPPPRPAPGPQPTPPTPVPPTPAAVSIKLPSSAFATNANDTFTATFQNLAAVATSTLPLFALSLDFSNNNIDLATDMQTSGGTLVVVDADFVRVSVLTITSNRLRNNSLVVPAAIVSLVDAVTMNGNQVLNEAMYNAAPPTKISQSVPLSLLYFPINVNAPVIPCAFTGNLLFGLSNLGLIRRNFAAPLDNWLFANAQL